MHLFNKQYLYFSLLLLLVTGQACSSEDTSIETLKDTFQKIFLVGTALDSSQISGEDTSALKIVKEHFNSIVAENVMKSEVIQPREGEFDFTMADKFVQFGEENNMTMIGHTLIWHSQAPSWFFKDSTGNDVSKEVLIERMKNHIHTIVTRYKGKIKGWDVVNEAILDNGEWRKSKFYEIIGEEFVELAFRFAHEADPMAELYYNDYSMSKTGKREGVVRMVKNLLDKGVKVDAIGMQGHISLKHPTVEAFEKSIIAFANLGIKVMITELDMTVIPMVNQNVGADVSASYEFKKEYNPYSESLPDSVNKAFTQRYLDFFNLFIKHSDNISRVTLWGVDDSQSWRNYWPVKGRTDYPLLFDREYKAKPIVKKLIQESSQRK